MESGADDWADFGRAYYDGRVSRARGTGRQVPATWADVSELRIAWLAGWGSWSPPAQREETGTRELPERPAEPHHAAYATAEDFEAWFDYAVALEEHLNLRTVAAASLPSGTGRTWTLTGQPSGDGIFPDTVQVEGPTLSEGERVVVSEPPLPSGDGERGLRRWLAYCDEDDHIVREALTAREVVDEWAKANGGFEDGQRIDVWDCATVRTFEVREVIDERDPEGEAVAFEVVQVAGPAAPIPPSGETSPSRAFVIGLARMAFDEGDPDKARRILDEHAERVGARIPAELRGAAPEADAASPSGETGGVSAERLLAWIEQERRVSWTENELPGSRVTHRRLLDEFERRIKRAAAPPAGETGVNAAAFRRATTAGLDWSKLTPTQRESWAGETGDAEKRLKNIWKLAADMYTRTHIEEWGDVLTIADGEWEETGDGRELP